MQKRVISVVVALAGLCVFCTPSEARPKKAKGAATTTTEATPNGGDWSLAEKEYWSKLQEELDGEMKRANSQCGTNIKGTFDKESFRGHFTDEDGYGLSAYARAHCGAAPAALEDVCTVVNDNQERAKQARDAVKAKITSYECKWGGKDKGSMNLASGKLSVAIDVDTDNASGLQSKLVTYMKDKL